MLPKVYAQAWVTGPKRGPLKDRQVNTPHFSPTSLMAKKGEIRAYDGLWRCQQSPWLPDLRGPSKKATHRGRTTISVALSSVCVYFYHHLNNGLLCCVQAAGIPTRSYFGCNSPRCFPAATYRCRDGGGSTSPCRSATRWPVAGTSSGTPGRISAGSQLFTSSAGDQQAPSGRQVAVCDEIFCRQQRPAGLKMEANVAPADWPIYGRAEGWAWANGLHAPIRRRRKRWPFPARRCAPESMMPACTCLPCLATKTLQRHHHHHHHLEARRVGEVQGVCVVLHLPGRRRVKRWSLQRAQYLDRALLTGGKQPVQNRRGNFLCLTVETQAPTTIKKEEVTVIPGGRVNSQPS